MQRISSLRLGIRSPIHSCFAFTRWRRPSIRWRAVLACVFAMVSISAATAQTVPSSLKEGGPESTLKTSKNMWTVGIAAGLLEGTNMRLADELAKVLDDGDNLRILPIVSYGAASNLDDLLYLRGVDVAITQADVFEYFRTERKTPNLEDRIAYILRLPVSEMHVLARTDIKTLEDLRGKRVNFGPAGSGSSLTGTIVFQRLGIKVEQTLIDNQSALQKLKNGEVDALVRVVGKPVDFFVKIPPGSGLHLVPIPFAKSLSDYYALGEFSAKDYPGLIASNDSVETIAVPAVLAAFNWQSGNDRHRRVKRFVEALFTKWDKLQAPQFHPKWRDINLAATVPGWKRLDIAEQQLALKANAAGDPLEQDFRLFMRQTGVTVRSDADREMLFRNFLAWRERQSGKRP